MSDINKYSKLGGASDVFVPKQPVDPENEIFHSAYIPKKTFENESKIVEEANKIQIRGVKYNLTDFYMIINFVKSVAVNEIPDMTNPNPRLRKKKLICFSYQNTIRPYHGAVGGKECPVGNARTIDPFCCTCRNQLIIAGFLCNQKGQLFMKDGKPICVFSRYKGSRFIEGRNYIDAFSTMDLPLILGDNSSRGISFEKSTVNYRRFVTHVTVDSKETQYVNVDYLKLSLGSQIPDEYARKMLDTSLEYVTEFDKKFNWESGFQSESSDASPTPVVENNASPTTSLSSIDDSVSGTDFTEYAPDDDLVLDDLSLDNSGGSFDDLPF